MGQDPTETRNVSFLRAKWEFEGVREEGSYSHVPVSIFHAPMIVPSI